LRRRHLGPRSPDVLATMTARCHMMKREPRIACYQGAIALARSIGGPRHPDLIRLQANLAQMLSEDSRTRPEACRMLAEAVEVEKQTFEPNFGAVLFSMQLLAQCQRDQGQIDQSLRTYQQAIAWATHPTGPRGDLYQDYAVFMMMRKNWPEAIKYLKASIADRELVYGPTNTRPIETRVRLADTYRRAGNADEALKELDAAIATCESAGATPRAYPELYQTKGHALMWIGRKEEGYHYLKRGLELHRAIGTPPEDHYETLTSLGEVESRLGKLDDAIVHLQQAMELQTLEAAPVYHAVPAFYLAGAFLKKGKASWPQGCEAARRALAGFSSPFGASLTTDLAETRKIMTKLRCPPSPAS
jgi:tetratricopeptide (TPR) repeat protein